MFEFDLLQSGIVVLVLLLLGEALSRKMKAAVPAVLAAGIAFIALVWAGVLPRDLIDRAGFTMLAPVCVAFMLISMGASISIKELAANRRVVALAAITLVAQTITVMAVIALIYDKNMAIGTVPGGSIVAFMIQDKARSLGYDNIVLLATLIMCVRGLIACPIANVLMRKEIRRLLDSRDESLYGDGSLPAIAGGSAADASSKAGASGKNDGFSGMAGVYKALFLMYAVAWLSNRLGTLTHLPQYLLCFVFGVLLAETSLLPRDIMNRTNSSGFFTFLLMSIVLAGFKDATPQMFQAVLVPLIVVMAVNIASIFLFGALFGRPFGFSRPMSVAIGLNIMIGFPINLIIAQDIIDYYVDDPRDRQMLMVQVSTKMVIAGLTSVTCLATLIGSVIVTFMS
ncbi:MAG: hypothetical protein IJH91_03550 [Mogibacterium sp.]|nr:hypothetical protein [Mogibacterium sp.]